MSLCTGMSRRRRQVLAVGLATACALMLAASTAAMAAEAYIQNGIGARGKALAGAGVASSTDATAASLNPAGLTNVGTQLNASVSFLNLDGGYTASPPGGVGLDADGYHASEPGVIAIPNLAVTWRTNSPLFDAIAFTAYGNGGVNTHYKDVANPNCGLILGSGSGVYCGGPLGIVLSQSFYSVAFAKEISRGLSVGVAPILAHQEGKVEGVGVFSCIFNRCGELHEPGHGQFLGRRPPRRSRVEGRARLSCRRGRQSAHLHDQLRPVPRAAAAAG